MISIVWFFKEKEGHKTYEEENKATSIKYQKCFFRVSVIWLVCSIVIWHRPKCGHVGWTCVCQEMSTIREKLFPFTETLVMSIKFKTKVLMLRSLVTYRITSMAFFCMLFFLYFVLEVTYSTHWQIHTHIMHSGPLHRYYAQSSLTSL